MKKIIPLLLGIGVGTNVLAAIPAQIPAPKKSDRAFRFKQAGTDNVALVDLVVAYQPPPTGFVFDVPAGMTANIKNFITETVIKPTSSALFDASNGAVQLGRILVVPADNKVDADVVILTDPDKDPSKGCPGDLTRAGEATSVCADAHTGGFLGLGWWLGGSTLADGSPVFDLKSGGKRISNAGARVQVSWNTLKQYPSSALIHEFGHYLFGMRDEYEGVTFPGLDGKDIYDATPGIAPDENGVVLKDATYAGSGQASSWPFLAAFDGYAMSYLSSYNATKGYSGKALLANGALPAEGALVVSETYGVSEQAATLATRGNDRNQRGGGMWSLETAIRTSKCQKPDGSGDMEASCAYAPAVASASVVHVKDSVKVDFYGPGVGVVFLLDASGSMRIGIQGSNPLGLTRWDAGVDFFGRLTHPGATGSSVDFPAGTKFGAYTFSTLVKPIVAYPAADITAISSFTKAHTGTKQLAWENDKIVWDSEWTHIVDALQTAKEAFDNDIDKPFRRNVVLISDGQQEDLDAGLSPILGTEAENLGFKLFTVSVDNDLNSNEYGKAMGSLASNSSGWEGDKGQAFFTNGDNSEQVLDESSNAVPKLTRSANLISAAIKGYLANSFPASSLFQDFAKEYVLMADANMKEAQFIVSWVGPNAPQLWLYDPDNRTYSEGNANGISFKSQANSKSFTVDLTKFRPGRWRIQTKALVWGKPITIYPSILTKNTKLQTKVEVNPLYVSRRGSLPIEVVVEDARPIQGATVSAVLVNQRTGVTQDIPLSWNGASYRGSLAGNIQPGMADLRVNVVHPNNGKVAYAQGENNLPWSLRTQYPYFEPRIQSQEIWVPDASPKKSIAGLEAWTLHSEPGRAVGTKMTLFIKNGTNVPLTGLKARYFFSLSENPTAAPYFSPTYLAGNSTVKLGSVSGRPGLRYVEFDFKGLTLQPGQSSSNGQNGGEGGYLVTSNWQGPWEVSNDYSFYGMKSTWAANPFVNIYDANDNLLVGNPDLDPPGNATNAAPIVSLKSPDLVVAGSAASFLAEAVDPDGDAMSYAWKVNGVAVGGNTQDLSYTFTAAGLYTVSVVVSDGVGGNQTLASKVVTVQTAGGACTESNSRDLGRYSSNLNASLSAGTNCFVVKSANIPREWPWSKLQVQLNSDNGVSLSGLKLSQVPSGSVTNLAGYSQTVPFADPGRGTNLYLKVQSTSARTVRFNWWAQ